MRRRNICTMDSELLLCCPLRYPFELLKKDNGEIIFYRDAVIAEAASLI
jgi:hypothetical protein